MSRRVIGVIVSLLLAAVGTYVLVSYVNSTEERALEGEEAVRVLVLTEPVESGSPVATLADKVKPVLIPAKVQAAGSVADLSEIEGEVVAVDLVPGEQIVQTRFTTQESLQARAEVEIPEDHLEVTISLTPDRAVGGELRPGDLVAFFASFEPFKLGGIEPTELTNEELLALISELEEEQQIGASDQTQIIIASGGDGNETLETPNSTKLILHKLIVTNVQAERLPAEPEEGDTEAQVDLAPTGNLLITLAAPAGQAQKVVFTAEHGSVWLASENENAPEPELQVETRGDVYR